MGGEFGSTSNALNGVKPVRVLRAKFFQPLPRAAVPHDSSAVRRFVNDRLNSRAAFGLGAAPSPGCFRVAWQSDLEDWPMFLLSSADRLVVVGDNILQMFDHQGRLIGKRFNPGGSAAIDPELGFLYCRSFEGLLEAVRLKDGKSAFRISFNGDVAPFIARRGRRMVVFKFYQIKGTEDPTPPHPFSLEMIEFRDGRFRKNFDEKDGPVTVEELGGPMGMVAMDGEAIIFADRNRIWRADLNLNICRILEGSFTAGAMALDEAGRIYLRELGYGKDHLWIITPEGEEMTAVEIPASMPDMAYPPIVDYDHRVFILAADRVLAYAAGGELLWEARTPGKPVGAAATADDYLLVSTKQALIALDGKGNLTTLHEFAEELTTPPILTAPGRIVVGSSSRLYCMERVGRDRQGALSPHGKESGMTGGKA